jgi:hypothetical protein
MVYFQLIYENYIILYIKPADLYIIMKLTVYFNILQIITVNYMCISQS